MAKVFGIHEIELQPGVTADAFEQFARDVLTSASAGCTISILKGERGARAGKYLTLMEFDTVETRDRWFPGTGDGVGPEAQRIPLVSMPTGAAVHRFMARPSLQHAQYTCTLLP